MLEPKTYSYIPQLQKKIITACLEDTDRMSRKKEWTAEDPRHIASTIATVSPPPTKELVEKHLSRFGTTVQADESIPSTSAADVHSQVTQGEQEQLESEDQFTDTPEEEPVEVENTHAKVIDETPSPPLQTEPSSRPKRDRRRPNKLKDYVSN